MDEKEKTKSIEKIRCVRCKEENQIISKFCRKCAIEILDMIKVFF